MLKKSISILVPVLILIFLFSSCLKKSKTSNEKEKIKILAVMTLSDNGKEFGQSSKNVLDLYSDELKKMNMEILYLDDENNKDKVIASLKEIINKEKIKAVLLCTESECGETVAEIASENKVFIINATVNSSQAVYKGKEYIYNLCYSDEFEGEALAQFSYENLKAKKAAVIFNEEDSYSKEVAEVFRSKFEKMGGNIAAWDSYNKNTKDFSLVLSKVKSSAADILILPDYYYNVINIVNEARKNQISSSIIGTEAWNSKAIISSSLFNSAYFVSEYFSKDIIPNTIEFKNKYEGKYKEMPDAHAALTYDALQVIMKVFKNSNQSNNTDKIKESLDKVNIEGVTGTISFDKDKKVKKTAIFVQIKNNDIEIVNKFTP